MKISVGLVFFLFLFSASVAAQTIPPRREPSRSPPLRELGRRLAAEQGVYLLIGATPS
jgi:hypothetical protein